MSALRLVFLPRDDQTPRVWRVENGRVVDRREGLGDLHADLPVIAVVPGEATLCRWLDLPSGSDAQAATAAALMLEHDLAQTRETLHVALGARTAVGPRLAVLVDRTRMQAWLDAAGGLPRLDGMIPDCLLPTPDESGETLALRFDDHWLLRGTETAMTVEPDLLSLIAADADLVRIQDRGAVESLLVREAAVLPLDLRQGGFAPRRAKSAAGAKGTLMLALLVTLSFVALPAARAARHALAARAAVAELKALSGTSDPAEATVRLRTQLDRLQAAERFPKQAAALLAAVERIDGMELQMLLFDDSGAFRLSALHTNYSDAQALGAALQRSGLSVQESSAEAVDGGIASDYLVRPAQ